MEAEDFSHSGNGICNDEAKCVCNKGFNGVSCQIECMGGSQNPCNGNGVCQVLFVHGLGGYDTGRRLDVPVWACLRR